MHHRWSLARPFVVSLSVFIGILVTGVTSLAFAEDMAQAHVAVVQFSNATDSSSYDAACKAATDTLVMTFHQLGRYRVQSEDKIGGGEDALRVMAEERQLDFIVYGTMSKSGSGIDCKLSVFDRAKGKTTLSQSRKAPGLLDIFDATDELIVSVLESMTGSHIGFGAITLTNTGEKGTYTVLVDGSPIGSDLTSLDRVLDGTRTVTIAQKRMLGDREIARSSVEVQEGKTAELSFAVPFLMDDEKQKVEGLRAGIKAEWNNETAVSDVDAKLTELTSLLSDVSYSPKLSTYKDEAMQLTGERMLRKNRLAIEASAWEPNVELLDAAGALYSSAKVYPNPETIKEAFEGNAQLMATLFELEAGKALSDGDLDKGLECFENALLVSTRYLGGARMMDYAYAMTMLKDFKERAGTQGPEFKDDQDLKVVFGALTRAGQQFYGLRAQVEAGTAVALVASDVATPVSVDSREYADAPLVLTPASGSRTMSVQPKGAAKPVMLTATVGGKLLFLQDGFASFGKIAGGNSPGSNQTESASVTGSSSLPAKVQIKSNVEGQVYFEDELLGDVGPGNPLPVENLPVGKHNFVLKSGDKVLETITITLNSRARPTVAFGKRNSELEPTIYKIGDAGPAGGFIFYDKGSVSGGWRYLEAAPSDQTDKNDIQWRNGYDLYIKTSTAVGTGRANTKGIIAAQGSGSYAANLCKNLIIGGFSDWFLPSKDELGLMYANLKKAGLGGFGEGWFWSSSQNLNDTAWKQRFSDGQQTISVKYNRYAVRVCRAF